MLVAQMHMISTVSLSRHIDTKRLLISNMTSRNKFTNKNKQTKNPKTIKVFQARDLQYHQV